MIGAKVIAVRESAGHDDAIDSLQIRLLVPQHFGLSAEDGGGHMEGVVIAVGAGQDNDSEFHS